MSIEFVRTRRAWVRATVVGMMSVAAAWAQSAAAATPKFEAVSVKPCKSEGGRGGGGGGASPGRLRETCVTLMSLIRQAYVQYANGRQNLLASAPIEGGPAWINSETYEIDAMAEGAAGFAMMRGPMLGASRRPV